MLSLWACTPPREQHLGALEAQTPHHAEMTPGAVHVYTLESRRGEEVRIELDQSAVDLAARVLDPAGETLFTYDTLVGTLAPESFCFTADAPGRYTLELRPFRRAGIYRVTRSMAVGQTGFCTAATKTFVAAQTLPHAVLPTTKTATTKAAALERAAALWWRAGELANSAMAWRDAGTAWRDLDRGDEAIRCYRAGLGPAKEAASAYLEISLGNRLGLSFLERGDLRAARGTLEEALGLARRHGETYGEATTLLSLGEVDEQGGDPHRAMRRYRQALPLLRRLDEPGDLARALLALADAHGLLDRHQEALDELAEAQEVAVRAGDRRLESDIASARAWTLYLRGDPARGLPHMRRALDLRIAAGDLNRVGWARNRLATLLRQTGDLDGAEGELRRAIAQAEASRSTYDLAVNLLSLGCLHQRQRRLEEAAQPLARARTLLGAIDDPKVRSQLEYCEALIARDRGDLDLALEKIDGALEIVDRLHEVARPQGHLYRPIWLWQDFAQLRADVLVALHRQTGEDHYLQAAFTAADADRSRNLFELVVESRLELEPAPRELLDHEKRIQQRLNLLGARIQRRPAAGTGPRPRAAGSPDATGTENGAETNTETGSEDDDLAREIRHLGVELEEVRAQIRAADETFARLARPTPITVAALREHLGPGTLLLSYDLGPERSYLFTLTTDELAVFDLAPRDRLEHHVEAFYHALVDSADSAFPDDDEQWSFLAVRLGELLVPATAIPPGTRRVLVVAEGLLHYLPFAALSTGSGLFIDRYEIAAIPSASVFVALRERRARRDPATKTVAIYADPAYASPVEPTGEPTSVGHGVPPPPGTRRGLSAERLPGGGLPHLPWTAREAAAILAHLPAGQSLLAAGHGATKEAVLGTDLRPYRLVHFATHARIDEEFPELSSLILSTVDRAGFPIDGELRLHEIFRLRLQADLTVLSGCQTALGRRVRGDGLLGFTRGFLYAGSSRVAVSLWGVDDRATCHLMTAFYEGLLQGGQTPAAALRAAQRQMRHESPWKAPYYWAPFVIQGDF